MDLHCIPEMGSFEADDNLDGLVAVDCPVCGGTHKYHNGRPTMAPAILPDEPSGDELAATAEVAFDESLSLEEKADRLDAIEDRYPRQRCDGTPCPEVGSEHAWMAVHDPETGAVARETCLGCGAQRDTDG